jgi:hypothetical protein
VSDHPYRDQPERAFWSRAVARDFEPDAVVSSAEPLFRPDDIVMSAGSCFASNLVPYLERAGFQFLRTEEPHPAFAHLPENLGYRNFTAAYGNIYTARQLRQLIDRSLGLFAPAEDRWHVGEFVIDPFRPGLRYPARSDEEFDALTAQHLRAVKDAFTHATVLVFTLGLTEAWVSTIDGAVYPACPGTVAGTFDSERHAFHNFTFEEVRDDLRAIAQRLGGINPSIRLILTVSPVPLVATATGEHVLAATTYSKSVLRAAAGEVGSAEPGVRYFPAYEIVTGPQAPQDFFEPDRREVSERAVATVMAALFAHCEVGRPAPSPTASTNGGPVSAPAQAVEAGSGSISALSRAVADAECEEALADVAGSGQ